MIIYPNWVKHILSIFVSVQWNWPNNTKHEKNYNIDPNIRFGSVF
jgi:hypothetical protein